LGPYNLQNLVAGIAVLGGLGVDLGALLRAASACTGAPGRMELVHDDGVKVIVDYAHTPDALEQLLLALKPHLEGALWLVFGCGGNRDKGKRAQMGAVAEGIADSIILTSDNPRDELPLAIIEDIRSGMTERHLQLVEPDRAAAIAAALDAAHAGDMVVIAGKGHEDYQEVRQQRHPFSDRVCVEQYYAARRAAQ
jgi:UDP-N-acetylmuramoyl-L-alanyl-D-glutamate--2,6-diaminopimelate ligase